MNQVHVVTQNGIRSRCGDINDLLKVGKITTKEAERQAKVIADRWAPHHPHLEFRVEWTGETASPFPLLSELLENVSQELGLLIHVGGYLDTCNVSDVRILESWLASLTADQLGRLTVGGDEELYAQAPKGHNGLSVAYLIQEFTV